jgi:uncharacterized protein (TIGR02231 family)
MTFFMNKTLAILIILGSFHFSIRAQENIITCSSVPEIVTIYLNGAEVKSKTDINVKTGVNRMIIKGLPFSMFDNSFQFSSEDQIELISVSTELVNLSLKEASPKAKSLRDSIEFVKQRMELINNQIESYQFEKTALSRNEYIGGTQTGVSLIELAKAADFFRERTLKINNALSLLSRKMSFLKSRLDSIQINFESTMSQVNASRKDAIVVFSSAVDKRASFSFRYLVSDAGWTASYDITAKDVNEPIRLKYKAKVHNNTGLAWKDVKIVLSTADPTLSAARPFLSAWILNYASNSNEGLIENRFTLQNKAKIDSTSITDEVAVSELNTSFNITKPYTIPGDGNFYVIDVLSSDLKAIYEYVAVPKLDLSAFLTAKIPGWEKLNLIDGKANIYFGNTYIGESFINTRLISDTLELSLGRDNLIVVSRAKVEDLAENQLIGSRRTEKLNYKLQIKNNRGVPVNIKLQDQVPVAQETDIVVEVEDISNANWDKPSGRLQWIKTIAPGESLRCTVAFSVKYPKSKVVSIRQKRIVSTPRYRH